MFKLTQTTTPLYYYYFRTFFAALMAFFSIKQALYYLFIKHTYKILFIPWPNLSQIPLMNIREFSLFLFVMATLFLWVSVSKKPLKALILCTITFGYFMLHIQTLYNNHYYLTFLILIYLCIIEWGWPGNFNQRRPIPVWALGILQLQFVIVYFYAGIAKIDPYWLSGIILQSTLGALKQHQIFECVCHSIFGSGGTINGFMCIFLFTNP